MSSPKDLLAAAKQIMADWQSVKESDPVPDEINVNEHWEALDLAILEAKRAKTIPQLIRRLQKAARQNRQLSKAATPQSRGKAYLDGSAFAFNHAVRILKGEVK